MVTPSGNATAVTALLKLAGFTTEMRCIDVAHHALAQVQGMVNLYPLGFGQWLQAQTYALSKPREIATVGDLDFTDTQVLPSVVRDGYRPFQVVALGAPNLEGAAVPLLRHRRLVNRRAAAYVCVSFTCRIPVTEPDTLRPLLNEP